MNNKKKPNVKAKTQCKGCSELYTNIKIHLRKNDYCREQYGPEYDEMMMPKKRDRKNYRREYHQEKQLQKRIKKVAEFSREKYQNIGKDYYQKNRLLR